MTQKEQILEHIKADPAKGGFYAIEISRALDMPEPSVRRCLKQLYDRGQIDRVGLGRYRRSNDAVQA